MELEPSTFSTEASTSLSIVFRARPTPIVRPPLKAPTATATALVPVVALMLDTSLARTSTELALMPCTPATLSPSSLALIRVRILLSDEAPVAAAPTASPPAATALAPALTSALIVAVESASTLNAPVAFSRLLVIVAKTSRASSVPSSW